ncbi:rho guanine exchange factor-like protein [Dermatophagoides farinae]|uniref:Rho guanine exchange factor-like protein n=2 Tax=Dermatophagoides farinae TaxID=6954 RepID=A0A9D4SHB3_DERFA|nr:uncharacterized protein LOC124491970 isoform X1 [Dermatophagoides farinae]KAH7641872.1 rho guanine exchange factor-like protein [Dermatophagoides farinae]
MFSPVVNNFISEQAAVVASNNIHGMPSSYSYHFRPNISSSSSSSSSFLATCRRRSQDITGQIKHLIQLPTSSSSSVKFSSGSRRPSLPAILLSIRENDGTLDSGEYHNQTKIDTTTTNTTDNYHRNSNHNNNNNKQQSNHSFNQSTNLRENYLNFSTSTETNTNNNNCNNRPPAIRSNSSASSLYPSLNSNNNNIQPSPNSSSSPTKSFTGNPNLRQRRGAMVSCDNLLADSHELFGGLGGSESTLKNLKNSSRKIGGIFSIPFKSDTEKMEQLSDLLKQYAENGIPDPKHLSFVASTNKLNHLRASSLSISSMITGGCSGNISPNTPTTMNSTTPTSNTSLLSTAKTSLSTTDLHRLHQHSNNNPLSMLSQPQQHPGQILSSTSFDQSVDSYYYLEPEWRSIVDNADQLPARIQSQNEAIWELLQTEVFYIRRLKVINDVCIACLLNLQNECLLTEIDVRNVFSNIGEVYEANHHFWMRYLLPMLNYSRETKTPLNPTMLEEGFLQFDQIFRPYIQYCLEHSKCLHYLKEKRKLNVLFEEYISWCRKHKDCERLDLMGLLVKPFQRLTKYSLLLKAILNKTDNETHKDCLNRMIHCVDRFVSGVNASMSRKQEYDALSAVVSRIESYDAIDCSNDEAEKFLKEYLYLDLMQTMPGCSRQKIRHLYLEDTLKLKDSTNKQDVHCFLFTDVFLVCKPLNKKSSDSRMKVIRQPFITDRLVVRELKDSSGFLLIYLNEFNVACTYMLLFTSETRNWVEQIRKAQEDYRSLKFSSIEPEHCVTYQNSYDDEVIYGNGHHQLFNASPRSSSRSSLLHSHSGSQDMGDQPIQTINQTMTTTASHHQVNCNQLSIQQQSPRAVSFELGDLRNPSLVVEDADSFARSQSFDNRSPVVTITSPRHERRAFLLRSQQQQPPQQQPQSLHQQGANSNSGCGNQTNVDTSGSSNYLNQNSLSVNVPYVQPVNSVPVQARQSRRSVPNISNMNSGNQNTIAMNEPTSNCQSNNPPTATIHVAVYPPPTSSPPPPPPSPPKRSPTKTITNRPLPPLPPQSATVSPPLPSVPPPSPPPPPSPSLMSISSRGIPSPMTMTVNKPPLVKTKNISYGVASMNYTPDAKTVAVEDANINNLAHISSNNQNSSLDKESPSSSLELTGSDNNIEMNDYDDTNEDDTKNNRGPQQKRTYRPDRRYHTADSIDHLKKEKDNSIHKRLSWNYGNQHQKQQNVQCPHHHHHNQQLQYGQQQCCGGCNSSAPYCSSGGQPLQPRSLASTHQHQNKCLSTESICSSSGFSSTASVPLSVGSVTDNQGDHCSCCSTVHHLQLHEEEEDIDNDSVMKRDHYYRKTTRKPSTSSDRDSALPISPSLIDQNSTPPIYYQHEHSNSQCSIVDHCGVEDIPKSPADSPDIKIDVREMKDGISSVQITLTGGSNTVTRPSKADLKRMKEFIFSNCNLESSEV